MEPTPGSQPEHTGSTPPDQPTPGSQPVSATPAEQPTPGSQPEHTGATPADQPTPDLQHGAATPPSQPTPDLPHGAAAPPSQPTPDPQRQDVEVRVRRSPKYGPFMAIGAVLGAIVMWVVGLLMPPAVNEAGQRVDTLPVVGLAIVLGFAIGAGLGGLVAVIIDRRLAKRAATLVAEQTDVDVQDERDHPLGA